MAVAGRENEEPASLAAGQSASGEFRCVECSYGVIVRSVLPPCPMCRGLAWEEPAPGRFAA